MPIDPITGKRLPYPGEPGYFGGMGGGAAPAMGGGQFTPEQSAYMMENMPAITQQESEIAQAEALSEQLRQGMNPGGKKRMDAASQGARAIEGFGSGMQDAKVAEGIKELDRKRKEYGTGLANVMRPPQPPQVPGQPMQPEDEEY